MKKIPNETDVIVGTHVRIRRKELGLSQTGLATQLGITFQQIQKYEKGTNRIGASRLHAISTILAVPVSYFFPAPEGNGNELGHATQPLHLLSTPGALDLLRDFAQIADRSAQKSLCVMARTLARATDPAPLLPEAGPKNQLRALEANPTRM